MLVVGSRSIISITGTGSGSGWLIGCSRKMRRCDQARLAEARLHTGRSTLGNLTPAGS